MQIPTSCRHVEINLLFLVYAFPFLTDTYVVLGRNTYEKALLTSVGRLLV